MRVVIRYYETGGAVHHLAGFEDGRPVWTSELGEAVDYFDDPKARAVLKACLAYHGREDIVLVRIRRGERMLLENAKDGDDVYRRGFAAGAKWVTAGIRVLGRGLLKRADKADARAARMVHQVTGGRSE